ncbi:SpoIIE family protein phosphatase [Treponema primitia]|uniref:SpoIIE family protein phosphatase n=1 Tax=Treponema primitia TaxID=88058 RepID=UPI00397EBA90
MLSKKIKTKVLRVILSTSLGALLLLCIITMISILNMRKTVLEESDQLGVTAARNSEAALEQQVRLQLMSLAEDKAALTDEKLNVIMNQTRMIAEVITHIYTNKDQYQPRVINYLQPDQVGTTIPHLRTAEGVSLNDIRNEVYLAANAVTILRQITTIDTGITANYIGGESGFFITVDKASSGPNRTDYDARTRSWYIGAKEKDGIFWTDIFADASGRGLTITCAMPFYDLSNGRKIFKGVAGSGSLISENVNKIIDSAKISKSGYAFVLNEKGELIFTSKGGGAAGDIGENYLNNLSPELKELTQKMINRESGIMNLNLDGEDIIAAYYPLKSINWSMAVAAPMVEVIAPAHLIQQDILTLTKAEINRIDHNIIMATVGLLIVIGIGGTATAFFATGLSNGITAPIISLSKDAKIISDGNLNHKMELKTGDELQMLAESFNHMIENIKQITGEKERIGVELNVATRIQASMLPSIFPPFPDREEFDIYASMLPAKEVGGDFYDFFLVNKDTLAVLIADVSGKGVPAALFMVIAKTLIKNNAQNDKNPQEVFEIVNKLLCENNEENMFVTVFMGYLDIPTGKLTYVNAGHNPPLIKQGENFQWLKVKPGLVLAGMPDIAYNQAETVLKAGDVLYLYTDGVTEAFNTKQEFFTDSRLIEAANKYKDYSLKEFAVSIKDEIDQFAQNTEQADDITMLVLQYKGRRAQ